MNKIDLVRIGIRPHTKGFLYWTDAIDIYYPNCKIGHIYNTVASIHGSSYNRIERALRYEREVLGSHLSNGAFLAMLHFLFSEENADLSMDEKKILLDIKG